MRFLSSSAKYDDYEDDVTVLCSSLWMNTPALTSISASRCFHGRYSGVQLRGVARIGQEGHCSVILCLIFGLYENDGWDRVEGSVCHTRSTAVSLPLML